MEEKKLGLFPMAAAILAGMIGSGVYDLSFQLSGAASPGGAIIAWLVCFIGMLMLVFCLQNLLDKEPGGDGMYVYANKLAGPLGEFMSGWGYWLSGWIGNIAFATMMMIALGTFFPALGDTGTSWPAIIVASIILWALFVLINRGVENAMIINSLLTILKIVPLVLFIVVTITSFRFNVFTADFWTNFAGNTTSEFDPVSIFNQVKNSMLSIMWLFMGVESAALMSNRAKSKSIAAKASFIGLLCGAVLMFIVSILPYGIMTAEEIQALGEPSVGKLLVEYIGPVGAQFVQGALVVSIFGAWISYTIMPTESTQILSEHGLLPERWGKKNSKGVATYSLFLTTIFCQLLLVSMHFTEDAYNFGFSLSGSAILVTWIMVTAYNVKWALSHRDDPDSTRNLIFGIIGTLYMLYAMFISGLTYILLLTVPFAVGFALYYQARKEAGDTQIFNSKQKLFVIAMILIAICAAIAYFTGVIE